MAREKELKAATHLPPPPPCGGTIYTVVPGDTMFLIARRFGVSLSALIAANPQISNPNLIFPGQQICIPGVVPPPPPPPFQCPPGTFPHIVQSGDTMFLIARRFGVTLAALIAANPQIPNPNLIFPGQTVCVPTVVPPFQCPPGTFPHIVQAGETMFTIAQRFGVTLAALIAANPQIPDPNRLVPGQTVCVPTVVPPFQCPPGTFPHIVQAGETMFTIAQRFGVSLAALIAANPQIPDPNRLVPGQTVCVPQVAPFQCPPGTFSYIVQPGDTMFTIARRFGVSLAALIAANPQIPDPSRIFPGQTVCVPRVGQSGASGEGGAGQQA